MILGKFIKRSQGQGKNEQRQSRRGGAEIELSHTLVMMLEDITKKPLFEVGTGYRLMLLRGILYLIIKPMFLLNFADLMLGTNPITDQTIVKYTIKE